MTKKSSHKKVIAWGIVVAIIMFGFCFAMVPLYSLICKKTGINTGAANTSLLQSVSEELTEPPDLSRTVTVQFVATNHKGLPWEFYPRTTSIVVHPGENNKIFFFAKNTTNKTMQVQAIPSMTPTVALNHFHKIQCFCFETQTLKSQESKEMPMLFRIDNQLPKEIRVITLAYTLFDTTPKAVRKG